MQIFRFRNVLFSPYQLFLRSFHLERFRCGGPKNDENLIAATARAKQTVRKVNRKSRKPTNKWRKKKFRKSPPDRYSRERKQTQVWMRLIYLFVSRTISQTIRWRIAGREKARKRCFSARGAFNTVFYLVFQNRKTRVVNYNQYRKKKKTRTIIIRSITMKSIGTNAIIISGYVRQSNTVETESCE